MKLVTVLIIGDCFLFNHSVRVLLIADSAEYFHMGLIRRADKTTRKPRSLQKNQLYDMGTCPCRMADSLSFS